MTDEEVEQIIEQGRLLDEYQRAVDERDRLTRERVAFSRLEDQAVLRARDARRALTLSVPCPYCHVPAGVACFWGKEVSMWPTHGVRDEASGAC